MSSTSPTLRVPPMLQDIFERASWSAGQQFFAILLATGTVGAVGQLPWWDAWVMALGAFLVSCATTVVQYIGRRFNKNPKPSYWKDMALRLVKTFLTSMIASWGVDKFDVFAFEWAAAFNLAMVATIGALGKGLLARQPATTEGDNPSTLPPATYQLSSPPRS